jgi:gluconolactonase
MPMSFRQSDFFEIASGLEYPEGPVCLPDGTLAAVDVKAGTLLRFQPKGDREFQPLSPVALGGSPNGAALGPDAALYICNSGGFTFTTLGPPLLPWTLNIPVAASANYKGGSIQRVSLEDWSVETWCGTNSVAPAVPSCQSPKTPLPLDPRGLRGPDDLVFDKTGGIWFTDWGKPSLFSRDITGVYYLPAGSKNPILKIPARESPNGIALSPDGSRLYVAETNPRWIHYWDLTAPGEIRCHPKTLDGANRLQDGFKGDGQPDSMTMDAEGNLYVATMISKGLDPASNGGITVFSPSGERLEFIEIHIGNPEPLPSNMCFGGPDRRTAFITLGGTGRIIGCRMKHPGLAPAFAR